MSSRKHSHPFLLAALALLTRPGTLPAQGASDAELATGIQQVEEGYYGEAVITLSGVVRRLGDTGPQNDRARAHVYLGVAQVGLGHPDQAKTQFRHAIELMRIGPGGKPGKIKETSLAAYRFSPKVTGIFEEAKREVMVATGEKEGRFPVMLAAAGVVGGGAAVVAAVTGSEPPAAPQAPGSTVTFVGANPASPATLSLSAMNLAVSFVVTWKGSEPAAVRARLLTSATNFVNCVLPATSQSFNPGSQIAVTTTFSGGSANLPPGFCSLPLVFDRLEFHLLPQSAGNLAGAVFSGNTQVSYTLVP